MTCSTAASTVLQAREPQRVDRFTADLASASCAKQRLSCRSFVDGICTSPIDAAIVNATIHIAHAMRIDVVGEGVETIEQRDCLRACGCSVAQGYLYGRPMRHDEVARMASLSSTRLVA